MFQLFKKTLTLFCIIILTFSITACGKKPAKLKRPTSEETTKPYPDTYPNSKTLKKKEHHRWL